MSLTQSLFLIWPIFFVFPASSLSSADVTPEKWRNVILKCTLVFEVPREPFIFNYIEICVSTAVQKGSDRLAGNMMGFVSVFDSLEMYSAIIIASDWETYLALTWSLAYIYGLVIVYIYISATTANSIYLY